VQEQDLV